MNSRLLTLNISGPSVERAERLADHLLGSNRDKTTKEPNDSGRPSLSWAMTRSAQCHPRRGNVHLRMAQHAAVLSEDHSLNIARAIVAAKLQSSRRMLLRWSRDAHDTSLRQRLQRRAEMIAERIARVPGAGSGDHLRGLEGDGARIYFRGLGQHLEETGIRFSARTRRPPPSQVLGDRS